MSESKTANARVLNLSEYGDKALGCWTGKNIGGTLGAPFEGRRDMHDVSFYTQDLRGTPAPNDDLDLQLVWLQALENVGAKTLNERILAEYWVSCIVGPWNEYGVCKANIRSGLLPPLSGSCNNDRWKNSNGAWIRAEIWACMFPGDPDRAIQYAYMDSCVDHSGEGIYAEMFVAALESAAFVIDDLNRLIEIGLSKIPTDCRVARSVKLACDCYAQGIDYRAAREAVVKDSEDLGWFQAPANVAFAIIGILYGEGDFGKAVCIATNCGDDTDCTAATAGAIMGIIKGRSGIPVKWIEPIGESIQTIAINAIIVRAPKTLAELTRRVATMAVAAQAADFDGALLRLVDSPTNIPAEYLDNLTSTDVAKRLWERSPYELFFDLPFMRLSVVYENGPFIAEGEPKKLTIIARHPMQAQSAVNLSWSLPEDWRMDPAPSQQLYLYRDMNTSMDVTLTPGRAEAAAVYMPLNVKAVDRDTPYTVHVPFQFHGATSHLQNWQWSEEVEQKRLCCRNGWNTVDVV